MQCWNTSSHLRFLSLCAIINSAPLERVTKYVHIPMGGVTKGGNCIPRRLARIPSIAATVQRRTMEAHFRANRPTNTRHWGFQHKVRRGHADPTCLFKSNSAVHTNPNISIQQKKHCASPELISEAISSGHQMLLFCLATTLWFRDPIPDICCHEAAVCSAAAMDLFGAAVTRTHARTSSPPDAPRRPLFQMPISCCGNRAS